MHGKNDADASMWVGGVAHSREADTGGIAKGKWDWAREEAVWEMKEDGGTWSRKGDCQWETDEEGDHEGGTGIDECVFVHAPARQMPI